LRYIVLAGELPRETW